MEFYKDLKNRKKKLYELKQLMRAELQQIDLAEKRASTYLNSEIPENLDSFENSVEVRIRRPVERGFSQSNYFSEQNLATIALPAKDLLEQKILDYSELDSDSEVLSTIDCQLEDQITENSTFQRHFDEHLYHLNTKKKMIFGIGDVDKYDYHERKSKEIRRLQYIAGLRLDKGRNRGSVSRSRSSSKFNNRSKELILLGGENSGRKGGNLRSGKKSSPFV